MKKVNVNLLPTENRFQLSQLRLARQFKVISFFVVGIWLVTVAVVFGLKTVSSMKLKALATEGKEIKSSLDHFSPEIELQQKLRFYLKLVVETLKSRPSFAKKLERVMSIFPEDVIIESINFSGSEIEIRGMLSSLGGVAIFEDKVAEIKKENIYQTIDLEGTTFSQGVWKFSLKLTEVPESKAK